MFCTACPSRTARTSRRCRTRRATRPTATTTSSHRRPTPPTATSIGFDVSSMLMMGGTQHRRYRALVQPSFVPAKAQWWIAKWIDETVHGLIDSFVDDGRAELNVDFCAAIPVLTITGSFGIPSIGRSTCGSAARPGGWSRSLAPIVEPRRREPQDDLISVLVEAELTDDDGTPSPLRRGDLLLRPSCSSRPDRARPGSRWGSRSRRCCSDRTCSKPSARDRTLLRASDRGVAALEADRSDVLPMGHRGHRACRRAICRRARSCTSASVPRTATRLAGSDPDEYDIAPAAQADARIRRRPAHLPRHARRPGRDGHRHRRTARPAAEPAARPRRRHRRSSVGFYERGVMEIPVGVRLHGRPPYTPPTSPCSATSTSSLPRDRRRGRLRVERRADAAASPRPVAQRRPSAPRR